MPKKASTSVLSNLERTARDADRALARALETAFPDGAKGHAIIRSGQIHPTPVTVVGLGCAYGHIRVKLDNAKPFSHRPCRDIHYTQFTPTAC